MLFWQFHENDRDTRSQSQNEEGPTHLSVQVTFIGVLHNLFKNFSTHYWFKE